MAPAFADLRRQRFAGRDADAQAVRTGAGSDRRMREQRRIEGGDRIEDRRPVPPHQFEDRVGRRPLRPQYRGGADRKRKGHRIAEPVGEEHLGGGEHDIVGADAKHTLSHQFGRRRQAGMDVLHAFRVAGGTGGIKPEGDFVGNGFRDEGCARSARADILQADDLSRTRRFIWRAAGHNHMRQLRRMLQRERQLAEQARVGDHRTGAAVGQDVAILLRRQPAVERDGDDPGAHGAPEGNRKIHAVRQQHGKTILLPQAEREQPGCKTAASLLQVPVGQAAVRRDKGGLAGKAARDIGVDKIDGGVIGPSLGTHVRHNFPRLLPPASTV